VDEKSPRRHWSKLGRADLVKEEIDGENCFPAIAQASEENIAPDQKPLCRSSNFPLIEF